MNKQEFTKIVCDKIEDKFIVLYLRWRKISKQELKLKPSKGSCLKITDPTIKSSIKQFYDEFKQSGLTIVDYFGINLVTAIETDSHDQTENKKEFNLRQTIFDESRKVRYRNFFIDYISIKTELLFCDRRHRCYLETDLSLIKCMAGPNGKTPTPFEIPLSCLVSMFNYPELQIPWTAESLEDYSELNEIGFNIYKLVSNKAKLAPRFPGLILSINVSLNFKYF